MIPVISILFGLLGWLVTIAATLWYLRTLKQMHEEMRTIRRYLQAIYERMERQ